MKIGLSIKQKIFLTANLHLFLHLQVRKDLIYWMITIIIFLIARLKKLGALADNEMFGLEPAYILGGKIKIFLYSKN